MAPHFREKFDLYLQQAVFLQVEITFLCPEWKILVLLTKFDFRDGHMYEPFKNVLLKEQSCKGSRKIFVFHHSVSK